MPQTITPYLLYEDPEGQLWYFAAPIASDGG